MLTIFVDIKKAISNYYDAITLIRKNALHKLIFISFLFYLIIFISSAYLLWLGFSNFIDAILTITFVKQYTTWLLTHSWLLAVTKIAFYISGIFFFISIFKFIFLTIASPLYAYISERTAEIILQKEFPFNTAQFLHDVWRGIRLSIYNFIKQMLRAIPLFILSFIPIVGLFFSFLIIVMDCYYYGFSMLDYNSERNKLSVSESLTLIKSRKGLAIGNGCMVYFSLLIPIVGIVCVAPISAVAATISYYSHLEKKLLA